MPETTPSIQDVPLSILRREYVKQMRDKMAAVRNGNVILAEIERRLATNLHTSLIIDKGKTHGEGTDIVDGVKMRCGVTQRVKWDTDALKNVYASLDPEVAEKLFKLTLTVPEAKFNAITDPKLNDALIAARTIELSKPYVEFVIEEGEIA